MTYDDWKTSEPEEEDDRLRCAKCGYVEHEIDAFHSINEDGDDEAMCPECGSGSIQTMAEYEEMRRDAYWDQKLHERREA